MSDRDDDSPVRRFLALFSDLEGSNEAQPQDEVRRAAIDVLFDRPSDKDHRRTATRQGGYCVLLFFLYYNADRLTH
jgi:hypothetical protein